jgi:uncharacterized protein (DUF885 family)
MPTPAPAASAGRRRPGAASLVALAAAALLVLPIAARAGESVDARWDDHVTRFLEGHFAAHPVAAVYAGRHEFDGRVDDVGDAALRRNVVRLQAERARTLAFEPGELSADRRREREYLLHAISERLFWQSEAEWPYRNPGWYLGLLDPEIYLSKPYAPLEQRMRAYVAYAREVPRVAEQIRANLRTPMPAPWIEYGYNAFAGFAQFYANDVAAVFASVEDEELQSQLAAANAAAARAMQGLAEWLAAERPKGTQDYALGERRFARMLATTEQVRVPLERLRAIGQADLERNLAELRRVCERYVPGGTLQACADKANAVRPEGGPVERARAQLPELRAFVEQRQLVTIPGPEQARVELAPPYNAQNFAYIVTAGPYETAGVPAIYYIAPPDPSWTAEEQARYTGGEGTLLSTSVHEVWPGHFLHFLHVNRNPSRVAQLFQGYAYTEGWAHYTEEMMRDQGLRAGSPEWHVGQLLSALLRNARYACALGLHTQDMTVAQCEQVFRDALADPGNARQQALRGTYDPAYLNYTLGKLMIMKLRDDWLAARDGKATLREFHDAFLALSGPLPLVRQQMLGDDSPPL